MALQLWLPLNGNVDNKGLASAAITVSGATVNTSGKIGSCYSFDGSDDYISINCSELYKIFKGGSQQFTIAFWIYHADTTRAIIFGDYSLAGTIGFNIELTTGHQIRFYWNGSPDKNFAAATAVAASEWTHIVLTYDGSKINIYKNGILQLDSWSGTLATKNKTSGLFYLGRDSRTGTTALNGKINDFRIYDTALSPREIKEIAKGLVLHYPLSGPAPEQLFGEVIEDNAIYSIRQSPNKHGAYDSIVGASVGWNQIATELNSTNYTPNGGISITKSGDTSTLSITKSGSRLLYDKRRGSTPVILANHVVYAKIVNANTTNLSTNYRFGYTLITSQSGTSSEMTTNRDYFLTRLTKGGACGVSIYFPSAVSGDSFICDGFQLFDLTTMFGSTIADRAQTLESSTVGAGVTWLKSCGFFADDYYSYDLGSIKSVEGLVKREVVGFNQWDGQWEVGEIYSKTGENRTNSTRSRSKNFIPVIPDTVYYHYGTPMAIDLYDQSKKFIMQIGGFYEDREFTTPSSCYYIKFFVNTNTMPSNICINISDSSKNGTYEPYISHSYSYTNSPTLRGVYRIDENNNLYADGDVWNSNGTVSRNYAVMVLDGTNQKFTGTFGLQDSGNYVVYKTMPVNRTPYTLCDRFVYSTQGISVMPLYSYVGNSGAAATWSFALPNTITSLDEANAWLVNNPVTIVYKKATPTIETASKFTNPQIIEPNGTELYSHTGVIPPGHITKYIDIEVEGGNYTYDESLENLGMTDNIEYDVSGYKYNGTKIGDMTYSSDTPRYQTSTNFNGIDNGILIQNLPLSDIINTSVTYSFWIKPSNENGGRSVYFGSYSGTSWSIEKTTANKIRGYWNGNPDVTYSNATITDNAWQHVCITKNGTSDVKIYINGVLNATSTAAHSTLSFPTTFRIGRDTRSGDGTPYRGLMSDFRIYATALSAEDVQELYHTPITLSSNGTLLTQGEYVEV